MSKIIRFKDNSINTKYVVCMKLVEEEDNPLRDSALRPFLTKKNQGGKGLLIRMAGDHPGKETFAIDAEDFETVDGAKLLRNAIESAIDTNFRPMDKGLKVNY